MQAFARAEDTVAQFERANAANRRAGVKADIISAALGPMFTTMSTITIAANAELFDAPDALPDANHHGGESDGH